MKSKLTAAEFAALHEEAKKFYTQNGDHYLLKLADEDHEIGSLRRSLDRERTEATTQKARADRLQQSYDAVIADPNKAKDVQALEKSYQDKIKDMETAHGTTIKTKDAAIEKLTVKQTALTLATKLAGDKADVLLPHIQARLQADLTGTDPVTRVLDKDGKLSAMTFDQLEKEFVDNKNFSTIIIASKASGGATSGGERTRPAAVPKDKKFGELSPTERQTWAKDDPEGFKQASEAHRQAVMAARMPQRRF